MEPKEETLKKKRAKPQKPQRLRKRKQKIKLDSSPQIAPDTSPNKLPNKPLSKQNRLRKRSANKEIKKK